MRLVGTRAEPEIEGLEELPGKANYFIGNDPAKWRTQVPTYRKVAARDVYPGIDVVYYGNERELEYDLVVKPGASPDDITLRFDNAESLEIESGGDLLVRAGTVQVRQRRPVVFQEIAGARKPLDGRYVLRGAGEVGFAVSSYDADLPLVIDPVVGFSTFLGTSGDDWATGSRLDADGNIYLTGQVGASDFPVVDPLQGTFAGGGKDAFLMKLDPTGSTILFSTYLGGVVDFWGRNPPQGKEHAWDLAIDSAGNIVLTGQTTSADFPGINENSIQSSGVSSDTTFVTKLSAAGDAILWSTYLGGLNFDRAEGVGLDAADNVYLIGSTASPVFPGIDENSAQSTYGGGMYDGFVAKLDAAGTQVLWATYLGGERYEIGRGIVVDSAGNAWVTGVTWSFGFPTTADALKPDLEGWEMFLTRFDSWGRITYSTYMGGTAYDEGIGITLDDAGFLYVSGSGSAGFPGTAESAIQNAVVGDGDAVIAKLDPTGKSIVWATYLGGSGDNEGGWDVEVDEEGSVYVVGSTSSEDFPVVDPLQAFGGGFGDIFVAKIRADGGALEYSTYLGGSGSIDYSGDIVLAGNGLAYVSGVTTSAEFPIQNALEPELIGMLDMFLTLIVEPRGPSFELLRNDEPFAPCGATVPWATGRLLALDVRATAQLHGDSISLLEAVEIVDDTEIPLPPGSTWELQQGGNPATTRLSWTPADDEEGERTFRFTALDSRGIESTCEITLVLTYDRDGDGLRDLWELDGYTAENGVFVDLPAMGANVDRKDIFVYVDAMADATYDHRMQDAAILTTVAAFAEAPVENPDTSFGIQLHVLANPIPADAFVEVLGVVDSSGYHWSRSAEVPAEKAYFDDFKEGFAGNGTLPALRAHFPPELAPVARYGLLAHRIADGEDKNGDGEDDNDDSGVARGAPSSDFLISLGAFLDESGAPPHHPAWTLQAGAFMHELGHLLGLDHGGPVGATPGPRNATNYKPNYLSVMNYSFWKGLRRKNASGNIETIFDYSRTKLPSLVEGHPLGGQGLDETAGLAWGDDPWVEGMISLWFLDDGAGGFEVFDTKEFDPTADNPVDWDRDGSYQSLTSIDINRNGSNIDNLVSFVDWDAIQFLGGAVAGKGASPELPRITVAGELDIVAAKEIPPPGPAHLAARAGRGAVRLSWKSVGALGSVTYNVYRDGNRIGSTISTMYLDRAVAPGRHDYHVTVVDSVQVESGPSPVVGVTVR